MLGEGILVNDSDNESENALILGGLVFRYTNTLMPTSYQNSEQYPNVIPGIHGHPHTSTLLKSEFALTTHMSSGGAALKRKWPRDNVANMLIARERGLPFTNRFTYSNKCRINNAYLPNQMKLVKRHWSKVFCGIFSKDGDYFMTASQDREIKIYDSKYGSYNELHKIQAQDVEWSIIDVAFSPDRQHVVYSTWVPSLHLCSINNDSDKQEILRLTNSIGRFCAFSLIFASMDEVLAAANDGCIYAYDLEKRRRSIKIMAHECDINTIALATESSEIVYSGGDDGLIKVWDRRMLNEGASKPVGILAGHLDGITHIDSKGDGHHLISNSKDQSIKLWDIRKFSSSDTIEKATKRMQDFGWDYRCQGVPGRMYKHQRIQGDTSLMTYKNHVLIKTLVRCRFSPVSTTGQRYIYTGCGLGRVVIYDALTGGVKRYLKGHNGVVRDIDWHPYRNEIVSSGWDGVVGCWRYLPGDSNEDMYDSFGDTTKNISQSALKRSRVR